MNRNMHVDLRIWLNFKEQYAPQSTLTLELSAPLLMPLNGLTHACAHTEVKT